jgi:hypothetical protein
LTNEIVSSLGNVIIVAQIRVNQMTQMRKGFNNTNWFTVNEELKILNVNRDIAALFRNDN